ncbi:hypothetical protein JS533_005645 [Bifidobacterium amazonense]|uniref:Uncharacterized protein n=1 Tax=Bifidobacterium amazonense TaxID=2809027 RepID=A0ABS9VUI1_9BIFI|nr:hypothetical protein [Bifidobacterium amazonense]MCH9275753.1 hypothetical protein [Bifidobacterium amazonense]
MPINWWRIARLACYVLLLITSVGESLLLTVIAVAAMALDVAEYLWEGHQHNQRGKQ